MYEGSCERVVYRHACLVVVLERNEWKEESRRIECIFGNKYNLNELAVNWKWAIQGYLTRGSPLASRPPPCSLSLQSSPSSSHVRSSVSFRLTSSLPPASPCTRTFSLFPSIRSFRDLTPLRRSKRYFRRQIPPQQRETFRTWGDASFPPPAYFSSSPGQEYTPRRSVFAPSLSKQNSTDLSMPRRYDTFLTLPLLHQSLYSEWNGGTQSLGGSCRECLALRYYQLTVYNAL